MNHKAVTLTVRIEVNHISEDSDSITKLIGTLREQTIDLCNTDQLEFRLRNLIQDSKDEAFALFAIVQARESLEEF